MDFSFHFDGPLASWLAALAASAAAVIGYLNRKTLLKQSKPYSRLEGLNIDLKQHATARVVVENPTTETIVLKHVTLKCGTYSGLEFHDGLGGIKAHERTEATEREFNLSVQPKSSAGVPIRFHISTQGIPISVALKKNGRSFYAVVKEVEK